MSAEDLQEIYLLYGNPLEKRVADIRNAQARARYQKPQKDTKLDLGSISNQRHSSIKFVNDHYNLAVHDLGTSEYFPATEPDYDKCRLIITTDHFGYKMFDDAQKWPSSASDKIVGQDVTCFGEPKLISGFDRGYGDSTNSKKRQALWFNRPNSPTRFKEYIKVTDSATVAKTMRILSTSQLSWFMRLIPDDLSSNGLSNNSTKCIQQVIDNDNFVNMYIKTNGKIGFETEKSGTNTVNRTVSTISTGNDYEIWWTYDHNATPKQHIIINGADQTLEAETAESIGDTSNGDTDMYIGKHRSASGGFLVGKLILVKMFHGQVVTPTEASQHFTNKLTIADIAYGKVATTEYPVPRNV